MLDTRSNKMSRKAFLLMLFLALVPAIILVSFYPRMAEDYNTYYQEKMTKEMEPVTVWGTGEEHENPEETTGYYINPSFPEIAAAACYYMQEQILGTAGHYQNFYDQIGWDGCYDTVFQESYFYGRKKGEETVAANMYDISGETKLLELGRRAAEDQAQNKSVMEEIRSATGKKDIRACLYLSFDAFGKTNLVSVFGDQDVYLPAGTEVREALRQIYIQFQDLLQMYPEEYQQENEGKYASGPQEYAFTQQELENLIPKNFDILFLLTENSTFIGDTWQDYSPAGYVWYEQPAEIYMEHGAWILILVLVLAVLLAGLLLPAISGLFTGREKAFCLPFEVVFWGIGFLGIAGAVCMMFSMPFSNEAILIRELGENGIRFFSETIPYRWVLVIIYGLSILGWAVLFGMEFIFVVSLRQFFCNPRYYLKNRVLLTRLLVWVRGLCRKLWTYISDLDLTDSLNRTILKLVLVNFCAVSLICCFWFLGIAGAVIYSIVLYFLVRKYARQIQGQYRRILDAAGHMAKGELQISLDEKDMGIFQPLAAQMNQVQEGFSRAVAEEAKSQNMKTELITNVSHDLKTPLTAIITYIDLLKQEDLTEEQRTEYVGTLERKADRLKVLIEDLFEVSKAASNNLIMNYADVDLGNLIKQVRLENEEKIIDSGLDFRWKLPEEKVILRLDPNRTYRIIDNLIQNILKYAMPHSRVYIDLEKSEAQVQVTFRNISAQEMHFQADEITERFVRGDLSRNTEGSGLGLAIARSFTELQGGTFRVEIDGDLFKVLLGF